MWSGWFSILKPPEQPFSEWHEVRAVILSSTLSRFSQVSEVSNRRSSIFVTWRLDIVFAWESNAETHISLKAAPHRIRSLILFEGDGQPSTDLLALQSIYPAGAMVTAYVNPANRDEAYLLYWPSPVRKFLGWLALFVGALILVYCAIKL
jgi:hypothetical protein